MLKICNFAKLPKNFESCKFITVENNKQINKQMNRKTKGGMKWLRNLNLQKRD